MNRYFFALDMDKAVETLTSSCHQCAALLKTPNMSVEQSSLDPQEGIDCSFAADVLKRKRQLVLVIRDVSHLILTPGSCKSERHKDLRDAIVLLFAEIHPIDGPYQVITDPAPGFMELLND